MIRYCDYNGTPLTADDIAAAVGGEMAWVVRSPLGEHRPVGIYLGKLPPPGHIRCNSVLLAWEAASGINHAGMTGIGRLTRQLMTAEII